MPSKSTLTNCGPFKRLKSALEGGDDLEQMAWGCKSCGGRVWIELLENAQKHPTHSHQTKTKIQWSHLWTDW